LTNLWNICKGHSCNYRTWMSMVSAFKKPKFEIICFIFIWWSQRLKYKYKYKNKCLWGMAHIKLNLTIYKSWQFCRNHFQMMKLNFFFAWKIVLSMASCQNISSFPKVDPTIVRIKSTHPKIIIILDPGSINF